MQDRYVGDIGDFAKYAILRSIGAEKTLRLGIVWCLFADESHNADGRHISYLERNEYRNLDSELHDSLARIVSSGRRSVRAIFKARIFRADTSYYEAVVAASPPGGNKAVRESDRADWIRGALQATSTCNIVFFDPDNGLEVPSVPKHAPKAGKYIFWDELKPFWDRGQSLVVYHHLNRTASVQEQTGILRERFLNNFPEATLLTSLLFRRGSCRHFWIVGQAGHASALRTKIGGMLTSGWSGYFEVG